MSIDRCPGMDTRFWRPGDIFEEKCPACGAAVEFFRDDNVRRCSECGRACPNPKRNTGCLEWCEHADACRELFGKEEKESGNEEKDHQD